MNNSETMARVYWDAQRSCGLKVGDYVKVIDKVKENSPVWPAWRSATMDKTVGMIGQIKSISSESIYVEFDYYSFSYPYFVLEKVEKPAHEFKPFDKVLVRDAEHFSWHPDIFLWKDECITNACYKCCRSSFAYCIPFNGNEHLCGTTDMPEE